MCIVHSTLRDATTPYTERYPSFWSQGIINPLPSKLEEVYGRFLLTNKWSVKKGNCAATLNNRGSHHRQEVIFDLFFIFTTF